MKKHRKKHLIIAFSSFVLSLLIAITISLSQGEKYLNTIIDSELTTISEKLNYELLRYKSLPVIIAKNNYFQDFLSSQENRNKTNQIQESLFEHAVNTGVDVIYLLDNSGTTLATSNYEAPDSFLGFNYKFRPYFYNAMKGQQVDYFALGTESLQRGFYFSAPIYQNNTIVGVVVVKVSLQALEEHQLLSDELEFMFTNEMGVIFISSYQAWNDFSLSPLPSEIEKALIEEKQFGLGPIKPLNKRINYAQALQQAQLDLPHAGLEKPFRLKAHTVNDEGWQLLILAPVTLKYRYLALGTFIGTLVFMVGYFFVLYLLGVQHTKNVLIKNKQELEARVTERTIQLRETNSVLEHAVSQYKETEASLQQTQSELIQAEKLAVLGEMSAGINHELNQPLAAMRAYAETGLKLFAANKIDDAQGNMTLILNLTNDMSNIIKKFKVFSRKSEFDRVAVDCHQIINDALQVLSSQINAYEIDIKVTQHQETPYIAGDNTLLEQVFVNIIYNAIQALQNTPNAQVDIDIASSQEHVIVKIEDNGPGLDSIDDLFTPFYTTKEKGLGLGLTLSKRIIELFGGSLTAQNRLTSGATFILKLLPYSAKETSK